MGSVFISIRGNSGSGKMALADELQKYFGDRSCLVLHEDLLRINILHAKESAKGSTIDLIRFMADLGRKNYPITILEGILPKKIYGNLLAELRHELGENAYFYYIDASFEQTVVNNAKKDKPFSRNTLKKWWFDNDRLGSSEQQITGQKVEELLKIVLGNLKQN